MNPIVLIFASIISLFIVLLIIKKMNKFRFCVICASVLLTWIGFLVLYWLGLFDELILIAVLMGGSVVGFYYWLEKRTKEFLHLFRLPVLLTMILLTYVLLNKVEDAVSIIVLILVLWAVFGLLYAHKNNSNVHQVIARIIACCRDW